MNARLAVAAWLAIGAAPVAALPPTVNPGRGGPDVTVVNTVKNPVPVTVANSVTQPVPVAQRDPALDAIGSTGAFKFSKGEHQSYAWAKPDRVVIEVIGIACYGPEPVGAIQLHLFTANSVVTIPVVLTPYDKVSSAAVLTARLYADPLASKDGKYVLFDASPLNDAEAVCNISFSGYVP